MVLNGLLRERFNYNIFSVITFLEACTPFVIQDKLLPFEFPVFVPLQFFW